MGYQVKYCVINNVCRQGIIKAVYKLTNINHVAKSNKASHKIITIIISFSICIYRFTLLRFSSPSKLGTLLCIETWNYVLCIEKKTSEYDINICYSLLFE